MELMLKNISPKDYILLFDLARRLGIEIEDSTDHPSAINNLKDAIEEIRMSETGKLKLQAARELINEL